MRQAILIILLLCSLLAIAASRRSVVVASRPAAAAAPFSPSDYGPSIWFDASVLSGSNNGDAVVSWVELSTNAWTPTQGTASARPYVTNSSLMAETCVFFDGGDYFTLPSGANVVARNRPGVTIATCVYPIARADRNLFFIATATENVARCWLQLANAGFNHGAGYRRLDADAIAYLDDGVDVPLSKHRIMVTLDYSAGAYLLWTNGVVAAAGSGTSGNSSDTDSFAVHFGTLNAAAGWFNGYMGELVVYNYALTTNQIQTLDTYMEDKW